MFKTKRDFALLTRLLACILSIGYAGPANAEEESIHASIGTSVRSPMGWVQFCRDHSAECSTTKTMPRAIVMTQEAWNDLLRVNRQVNEKIKPITDMDHWGTIEKWSYPTDGYGDCEEYVLQKRKILMSAGWPRESLLITVVHDKNDEGHAVLTVVSDKGDFILDNESSQILRWDATGYRYVKRQSQSDSNEWVALGTLAPTPATATTHGL
jgi:predicted transglutaminase-like cysteine proteinase